jgi:hypothetical protein
MTPDPVMQAMLQVVEALAAIHQRQQTCDAAVAKMQAEISDRLGTALAALTDTAEAIRTLANELKAPTPPPVVTVDMAPVAAALREFARPKKEGPIEITATRQEFGDKRWNMTITKG